MATVLLVNGPNLGRLGEREPEIYGHTTLKDIEKSVSGILAEKGHTLKSFQSNSEGDIINWLEKNLDAGFIIINAASLTHTSVGIRDCLAGTGIRFIEVHISNVYKREEFRHFSYLSDIAEGVIVGLGVKGYDLAAQYIVNQLK